MRRVMNGLVVVAAALALGSMVLAQATTQAAKKPAQTSATVEKRAPALWAMGKVLKVNESAKTLTLATADGDRVFTLATDAKIMAGASTAKTADLPGKTVKVTYSTVNGKNLASKVTIAAAKPNGPPAKQTANR
jgi:hypothetical protein